MGRTLQASLVIPAAIVLSALLYLFLPTIFSNGAVDETKRTLAPAFITIIFVVGGIIELVATPIALKRLIQNAELRTKTNVCFTLMGSLVAAVFVFVYVKVIYG